MDSANKLFEINNLKKHFKTGGRSYLKALDGISFNIYEGETLGLVGESGCGKTTCGRTCLGLYGKTDGQVLYRGKDVHTMRGQEKKLFKKHAQIVFQDPYSSLDPRMTVTDIIAEGIDVHAMAANKQERLERVYHYLEEVGLKKNHAGRFAHEFSGGQRQRIGIARALAVEPEFIMLDEPISALDVSIQAQIINLLLRLQRNRNLTYLFVAHDLTAVRHISDRVIVMYLGTVMEIASSNQLYDNPLHPYTKNLLAAIPIPDPELESQRKSRMQIGGEAAHYAHDGEGCRFRNRCPYATQECGTTIPELREVEPGHFVSCDRLEVIG